MPWLLIEDDPALQVTLHRTLESKGISVGLSSEGRLAVERWKMDQPDVVVLDLSLPGLEGLEIVAQARAKCTVA